MSDREDKLTRAQNLITDMQSALTAWSARLGQAKDGVGRLSAEDLRDIMVIANGIGKKATEMVAETLGQAFALTQDVALADNLRPLVGDANAAALAEIQADVFRQVRP
jgi:hypothetical protein